MKGVWRKTAGGLRPADPLAEEVFAKIPLDGEVMAEVTRPRNLGHHKKLFALVQIIRDNQAVYKTSEDVLDALKIAVGHCDTVKMPSGVMMVKPRSIAFHQMDQLKFEEFWNSVVDVVVTRFLPKVDRKYLEDEIRSLVS